MPLQTLSLTEIKARAFADPEVFESYLNACLEDSPDTELVIEPVRLSTAVSLNAHEKKK